MIGLHFRCFYFDPKMNQRMYFELCYHEEVHQLDSTDVDEGAPQVMSLVQLPMLGKTTWCTQKELDHQAMWMCNNAVWMLFECWLIYDWWIDGGLMEDWMMILLSSKKSFLQKRVRWVWNNHYCETMYDIRYVLVINIWKWAPYSIFDYSTIRLFDYSTTCLYSIDRALEIFSQNWQERVVHSFLFIYTDFTKWNGSSQPHNLTSLVPIYRPQKSSAPHADVNFEKKIPKWPYFEY